MHNTAVSLFGIKEVGRFVTRQGDNRRKMMTNDLIDLYGFMDRRKADLPLFVAASMARIPGIRPLECDVVALSVSLSDLKQQVLFLQSSMKSTTPIAGGQAGRNPNSVDLASFPELSGLPLVVNMDSFTPTSGSVAGGAAALSQSNAQSSMVTASTGIEDGHSRSSPTVQAAKSAVHPVDVRPSVPAAGKDNDQSRPAAAHSSVNGLLASRSGTSSTFSSSNGSVSGVKTANATRFKAVSETRSWHCKISRVSK